MNDLAAALVALAGPEGLFPKIKNKGPKPRGGNPTPDSIQRKNRRNLKRLSAFVGGGWQVQFSDLHRYNNLPESTRPERRRAKLGRA